MEVMEVQVRSECPHTCHDWPLPNRFEAARQIVRARKSAGWQFMQCPNCEAFGWDPGPEPENQTPDTNPVYTPATPV
jgi:hypothetical protein